MREEMNGGHTPDSRRDHRFGSLRSCACARRETMPGWLHLSGLQRGERCSDLPGRETGGAGIAASCGPSAKEYLATERRCANSTTAAPASIRERVPILANVLNVAAPSLCPSTHTATKTNTAGVRLVFREKSIPAGGADRYCCYVTNCLSGCVRVRPYARGR